MTLPHTPTPWFADGFDVYAIHPNGRRYQIAKAYMGWIAQPVADTVRAEQQAAFIVHACNRYGPLVALLAEAKRALDTVPRFRVGDTDSYRIAARIEAILPQTQGAQHD
jgi:hypothetical protein